MLESQQNPDQNWLVTTLKEVVAVLALAVGLMGAQLKRMQSLSARKVDKPASMDTAFKALISESLRPYEEKLESLKDKIVDDRRETDNRFNHIDNQLSELRGEIRSRLQ